MQCQAAAESVTIAVALGSALVIGTTQEDLAARVPHPGGLCWRHSTSGKTSFLGFHLRQVCKTRRGAHW
jgi:hypothetical protein